MEVSRTEGQCHEYAWFGVLESLNAGLLDKLHSIGAWIH